jgi:D-3-phosphoglycerate dehydrogenase
VEFTPITLSFCNHILVHVKYLPPVSSQDIKDMYKVKTLNQISTKGLNKFSREDYEVGTEISDPDAILVRSHKLSIDDISPALRAVGRAGAGVNNIPVPEYTRHGVVVFNTPGANANAVKELVMAALLLSSRDVLGGIRFVREQKATTDPAELNKLVESEKKKYKGNEVSGKTLGVLGLGAIGSLVAEMGLQLGMNVVGYDPALSVDAAWRLSSQVQKMPNMQALFSRSDFVTLHVPAMEATKHLVNDEALEYFRQGAVLLNYSREQIVDPDAVRKALQSGKLASYFCDFPVPALMDLDNFVATPHLGASTDEAEENCAVMVSDQVIDFLENGNIKNSVNFPEVNLERTQGHRLAVVNQNVPRILGKVLSILADGNINVIDMLNKSRDDVAYNLIDIESKPDQQLIDAIQGIEEVINVRVVENVH